MAIEHRYETLRRRHRALENKIVSEMGRPLPDHLKLQRLKRLKLRVRDEIELFAGLLRSLRRQADGRLGAA